MAKLSPICIFCGSSNRIHREHFISDWMKHYLPWHPRDSHVRGLVTSSRGTPRIKGIRAIKKHTGSITGIRLRAVCQDRCNGGWMSRLEQRAKPILIPLITGQPLVLAQNQQRILSAWITMKIMVAEFEHATDVVSMQNERDLVMNSARAPDNWQIWIGHQSGGPRWLLGYSRQSATLWVGTPPERQSEEIELPKNTQFVTIGIGQLFIQAISTTVAGLSFDPKPANALFQKQIWPYRSGMLWPCLRISSDAAVENFSRNFDRMITAPTFKWIS